MLGRRETFLSLGALGFLTTEAQAGAAELKEAATKEGNVTWYVAQMDAAQAEAMGKAFTAEYPGITVSVIRSTGQVAYQRLLLDFKNKTPQCDVFSATDSSHMPILKEADRVSKYEVENFKDMLPQFAAASVPGYYYTTVASRYFMIYNNQKVAAADAPKAWTDLLNPKWKGRVAFGHPAFSGCTGALVVALRKLYGWEYFEKLAKNNPKIGRSAADPVTLIVASECLVGPASAGGA